MSTLSDLMTADRRLQLLRLLLDSPAYTASGNLLHNVVDSMGHAVSYDRIATDLAWLKEQDMVSINPRSGITLATLTARGVDVANGIASVPGIARPRPE